MAHDDWFEASKSMKVLLIGSGGREHALAWRLAASSRVTQLFAAPGNPGIGQFADNLPELKATDLPGIEKFVRRNGIELVVVGPEDPLAMGIVDRLAEMKVKVFGPNKIAAQLEADKWFAKEIMRQQAIPTAEGRVFTEATKAEEYVQHRDEPCVIKATGLAKGKGVTVCHRTIDAMAAIDRIMRHKEFGQAGERIVVEEFLQGPECSILAFVDRKDIYLMEGCQDHKPVEDGDIGPMTGGMGAYSPTPIVTDELLSQIEREILVPLVDGLVREEIEYKGVLYAGLMLTNSGPRVLEFNCRFGDPETQPLMMRLKSDLAEAMLAVVEGRLQEITLEWDPRPALCVVAASKGYPGKYPTGLPISGLAAAGGMPDVQVFHSGTKEVGGQIVTDGGRVLSVTAVGNTVAQAQKRAYEAMSQIHFEGMHYRRDIGRWAIQQ
jgi:phosphoribosylamine--glycine ligase